MYLSTKGNSFYWNLPGFQIIDRSPAEAKQTVGVLSGVGDEFAYDLNLNFLSRATARKLRKFIDRHPPGAGDVVEF